MSDNHQSWIGKNVRLEGNCRQKSKRAISTIGCEPRQRFVAPALRSLSIAVAAQQQQGKRIRVKKGLGGKISKYLRISMKMSKKGRKRTWKPPLPQGQEFAPDS